MRVCESCGTEYEGPSWRPSRFCGWSCYQKEHRVKGKACPYCLNLFTAARQFCSKRCRYRSARKDGTRYVSGNGYVYVKAWNARNAVRSQHWVLEHRLIVSRSIGRPLRRDEHVHHKNGIRTDNRKTNLRLFSSNSDHQKFHAKNRRNGKS